MKNSDFEIINPATLRSARESLELGCGTYEDAPVCTNGNEDVACDGERYRGCAAGTTDCANNPDNNDDSCCWGWGPGTGDNIDHQYCSTADAEWGGTCFWSDEGNEPLNKDDTCWCCNAEEGPVY